MQIAFVSALFAVAAWFLALLLIRLNNIGSMKRLWPLATTVALWLVFGLWQINGVLLEHALPPIVTKVWPILLLVCSFVSWSRV